MNTRDVIIVCVTALLVNMTWVMRDALLDTVYQHTDLEPASCE